MDRAQVRALRREAWELLADASTSDPVMMAWAAGVVRCTHVMHLCYVWAGGRIGDRVSHEGGTTGGRVHRYYGGDRHGLHLGSTPLVFRANAVLTVRWGAVEALIHKAPKHLRPEAEQLMAHRRKLAARRDMLYTRYMCGGDVAAEQEAFDQQWAAAEASCEGLGALIWQHLRPASQQLDLLSLLA